MPNPNAVAKDKGRDMSVWMFALERRDSEMLKLLKLAQKNLEVAWRKFVPWFNHCCKINYEKEKMLDLEERTNQMKNSTVGSPLFFAIKHADDDDDLFMLLEILLEKVALTDDENDFMTLFDPRIKDTKGNDILHLTCIRGFERSTGEIMRYAYNAPKYEFVPHKKNHASGHL